MASISNADAAGNAAPEQSAFSKEWAEYIGPLVTMGDSLLPLLHDAKDPQARHELYEYIYSQVASGYAMLFYEDPANPDWWPLFSSLNDALWCNPDTVYFHATVDAKGIYRLSGNRGATLLADVQLGGGNFIPRGVLDPVMSPVQNNISLDTLSKDANGDFELIVSAERPAGYSGNWVHMTPATTYLLLRQVSYDWSAKQVAISIERLDTPARGTRRSAEDLRKNLLQVSGWVRNWISMAYAISKRDRGRSEQAGDFVLVDWLESAFGDQKYHAFAFDLKDDEVVIVEHKVPRQCAYWAYQMVTDSWRAINPLKFQSSLNPEQVHIDKDGVFRAVISSTDPGVKNWLDTGGHDRALVYSRFNGCDVTPMPTARVVKKADLKKLLPADTAWVTPQEREAALRERARKHQLRRRW